MRHICCAIQFATGAVFAMLSANAISSESEPVPVYLEPDHHLVFQNGVARVLDIRVPSGHVSEYHVHANPLVSVTVQDARSWSQKLGEKRGAVTPRGEVPAVGDNWDQPLPYTHRVGNVDTIAYHRIAAEWLRKPDADCSPLGNLRGFRLVREGQYGRVYEARLLPGQSTSPHTHACPGLTVQGSAGALKNIGGAATAAGGTGAGHWFWRNAQYRHVLRNDGRSPVTVFEIDWR